MLGAHAPVLPGDLGAHVLIGDEEHLGRYSVALGRATVRMLFKRPGVLRIVGEPDVRNENFLSLLAFLGFRKHVRDRPARQARGVHGLRARGLRAAREPPPAGDAMSLALEGVVKRYGERAALDGVDLESRGRVLALLGPNGAGKSTLVSLAAGLSRPDAGTVRVAGRPGVAPQEIGVYPQLTVHENLRAFAELYGVARRAPDGC